MPQLAPPRSQVPFKHFPDISTEASRRIRRNFEAVSRQLIWVTDASGNVSLAVAATAFTVNATGDIVLDSSTGKVSLVSDISEVDLTAATYVNIISGTGATQLTSTKVDASGLSYGTTIATTGGSGIKLTTSGIGRMTLDSGGDTLVRSTAAGAQVSVAATNGAVNVNAATLLDMTALGTSARLRALGGVGSSVSLEGNTSAVLVKLGTAATGEQVKINDEPITLTTGNVNGNYLSRVAGVWQGVAPPFTSNVLTSAHILVGNGSNVATDVAMTGDISITNAGVTAIGALKVATGMLQANAVTLAKLATQADQTILGNNSGGAAVPSALTVAQTKTLLAITESDVASLTTDLAAKAPLASPTFTGHPTGVTELSSDNSTRLASTAYVTTAVAAIPTIGSVDALLAMGYYS